MDPAAEARRLRTALEHLVGVPSTEGNGVEVLRNGVRIFPSMLEEIRRAETSIDLQTFVYWTGQIAHDMAHALASRSDSGVRVRVLLDAVGARSMDRELVRMMEEAGTEVEWFRPPTTLTRLRNQAHRTHRKVLVCDARVGFTGGVGIASEWEGDARDPSEWRDTHVRIEGPAVVGLRAAFASSWQETGQSPFGPRFTFEEVPAAGDAPVQIVRSAGEAGWSDMRTVFRGLVSLARHRLRISTAYFSPDEELVRLFGDAVDRGVEVDILLPGRHADKRLCQLAGEADYGPLLERGVRLWNYQRTMLHTKIVTVDGGAAVVGSANFNHRAMSRDEELVACIFHPPAVQVFDGHFTEDLEAAEAIDAERWEERPTSQKLAEELVEGTLEEEL